MVISKRSLIQQTEDEGLCTAFLRMESEARTKRNVADVEVIACDIMVPEVDMNALVRIWSSAIEQNFWLLSNFLEPHSFPGFDFSLIL